MKKSLLCAVLVFALFVAVLSGCTQQTPSQTQSEGATQAAESSAPASEASEDKETIRVGVIQDTSGPTSIQGLSVQNGIELNVEEINAAGGIDGHQIELFSYDCKADPQEAITAYQRLAQIDKVSVVLGPPLSNVGLACIPITNETKIPFLGLFAMGKCMVNEDGSVNQYMFAAQPTGEYAGMILAEYTMNKLGIKKFAVLGRQDQAFLVAANNEFTKTVTAGGGEIVSNQTCKTGDTDFKVQINTMMASDPEMIVFFTESADGVIFANQAQQLGVNVPMGSTNIAGPPFLSLLADPSSANNIYFPNNLDLEEDRVQLVGDAYIAKYGKDPDVKSYIGYDLVTILKTAIEKADNKYDSESITQSLANNISNLDINQGTITLDQNHMPAGLSMVMYNIENGEYVSLGRYMPGE